MNDPSTTGSQRSTIQTPSQTVGPFFGYALPYANGGNLVPGHHPRAIRIHGTVVDGAGVPVVDALLEIWQADEAGKPSERLGSLARDGYTFTGFGRTAVDLAGHFSFTTVKPGIVGKAAPHVLLAVFARGLSQHLFTRVYFPEDAEVQRTDTLLSALPEERRSTLVSEADAERSYRLDIHLQGDRETVFLDFDGRSDPR